MARKKRKKRRGWAGNGLGCHQEVSPMARGTRTPSRAETQGKADRRIKQQGWNNREE